MPRTAGAIGKNKSFLMKRLQEMYGDDFHPIMKMAENAVKLQKIADDDDPDVLKYKAAIDSWDKIAQYTEPKLKAIEISGEIHTRPILVDLSGGDLTLANQINEEED